MVGEWGEVAQDFTERRREKNVTAARPSEQFEPLGSMIRSLEFQAGGFYVLFCGALLHWCNQ